MKNCNKILILILGLCSILNAVGCASIRDTHQEIPFACNAKNCDVTVDGNTLNAPVIASIDRKQGQTATFQYHDQIKTQELKTNVRWLESVFGNLFIGAFVPAVGIAGMAVVDHR